MEQAKSMKSEEKGGKEMAENFQQMFFFGLLNSALASLKMGDTLEAIKFCDKVLEKNATNVKALYRKAQVFLLFLKAKILFFSTFRHINKDRITTKLLIISKKFWKLNQKIKVFYTII